MAGPWVIALMTVVVMFDVTTMCPAIVPVLKELDRVRRLRHLMLSTIGCSSTISSISAGVVWVAVLGGAHVVLR